MPDQDLLVLHFDNLGIDCICLVIISQKSDSGRLSVLRSLGSDDHLLVSERFERAHTFSIPRRRCLARFGDATCLAVLSRCNNDKLPIWPIRTSWELWGCHSISKLARDVGRYSHLNSPSSLGSLSGNSGGISFLTATVLLAMAFASTLLETSAQHVSITTGIHVQFSLVDVFSQKGDMSPNIEIVVIVKVCVG